MVREWSPAAAMLDARDSGAAVAIDLQVSMSLSSFTICGMPHDWQYRSWTHTHTRTHTHTHTHAHTCAHTHAHTCPHMHTRTHQVRQQALRFQSSA